MKAKKLIPFLAVAAVSSLTINSAEAAITLDGGWESDTANAASAPSDNSPYVFSSLVPVQFSVTDAFIVGDTFTVFNGIDVILTSAVGAGVPFAPSDPTADSAWESGSYSIGSVLLEAGDYAISVETDGVGGIPAGFFVRLDSVSNIPEPSGLLSLGALLGFGLLFRTRR